MALPLSTFVHQVREGLREPHRYTPHHPVVHAIHDGRLSLENFRRWTIQNHLVIGQIGRVIAHGYGSCTDPEVRKSILAHLVEEELGLQTKTGPHIDQLTQFAEALGVSREQLKKAQPNAATTEVLNWMLTKTSEGSAVEAWAINTSVFSIHRIAFREIATGIDRHYQMDPTALRFWHIHAVVPKQEEADNNLNLMAKYLVTTAAQNQVRHTVFGMMERWYQMWTDAVAV